MRERIVRSQLWKCYLQITGRRPALLFLLLLPLIATTPHKNDPEGSTLKPIRHVIHISVDGLRPDAIFRTPADVLPNFYFLRTHGSFTDNARTDYDYSITLPNHISQLTGRPVLGPNGHHWTENRIASRNETLHSVKGSYLHSVFDVVHNNGMRTGAYVSKEKFEIIDRSYDKTHGAIDRIGEDNGKDKIDEFVFNEDTGDLVSRFIQDMRSRPYNYVFLHLRDPDAKGHSSGWSLKEGRPYMTAVKKIDYLLGEILEFVQNDRQLAESTVIVLTTDHGGNGLTHGDASKAVDYTIPFYVWGVGVPAVDLYALNAGTRRDPAGSRPKYDNMQPIRNGDAANVSLSLLRLGPVPGATINVTDALALRSEQFEVAHH